MDQNPNSQNTQKSTEPTADTHLDMEPFSSPTDVNPSEAPETNRELAQEPNAQPTPNPAAENRQLVELAAALPPKKKHTGIIILIAIIALLILTGGGFLIWYFAYYSNPERVVFEAVENLIGAEHLSITSGQAYAKVYYTDDQTIAVSLDFDTTALSLPSSTNAKLTFWFSEGSSSTPVRNIQIDFGTIQLVDGTLYLKVGNLINSIDTTLEEQGLTLDDLGPSAQLIYDIVAEIDNEWWQISYRDLLEKANASQSQIRAYEDFYTCMIDLAKQNHSTELKTLYDQHRFLNVAAGGTSTIRDSENTQIDASTGYKFYDVSLNFDELAGFINALPESQIAEQAYDCYNQYARKIYGGTYNDGDNLINAETFSKVSASDLRKVIPDDYSIHLAISNFGHQISHIMISDTDGDTALALKFGYQAIEVSAPDNYRPLTELFEKISELVQEMLMTDWSDDEIIENATYDKEAIWES